MLDLRGIQEEAVQALVGSPGLDMTLQEMAALEAAISSETSAGFVTAVEKVIAFYGV